MHTISNLIYIILVYFDLLTKCMQDEIFCSSVSNSIYVQYINTYFVKWLKGSLITFSNITYTSFILARYIQVSDTKNENLLKFKKISLKLYLFITILISVFINIYIIFEYSIETVTIYNKLEKPEIQNPNDKFLTNLTPIQCIIFNVFQYFKIIISDVLFYILTVIIDKFY